MPITKTRPVGITIIAFILGAYALFGLCGNLTALSFAPLQVFHAGLGAAFGTGIGALLGLVFAIAELGLAIGLFTLQPWAFWATAVIAVLDLFGSSLTFAGHPFGLICGVRLVPLLLVIYLFADRNVRRAFNV